VARCCQARRCRNRCWGVAVAVYCRVYVIWVIVKVSLFGSILIFRIFFYLIKRCTISLLLVQADESSFFTKREPHNKQAWLITRAAGKILWKRCKLGPADKLTECRHVEYTECRHVEYTECRHVECARGIHRVQARGRVLLLVNDTVLEAHYRSYAKHCLHLLHGVPVASMPLPELNHF
jgi:hypothetical protein